VGIDFHLYDDVTCDISGPNTQNLPVVNYFHEIYTLFPNMVPKELEDNIRRCGYDQPTPVQKYSIPVALAGRDVMCCAQTGSGKTAAFLVPMLASMIKNQRGMGNVHEPFRGVCKPDTLILAPTRELCLQIYKDTCKFCYKTPHRCVRVYGQEPAKKQIYELAKGADIIVATPGRLWDFVHSGIIAVTDVQCLVIDEADIMISKQMDGMVREIIEKCGMPSKDHRHTMMFSATFPR
jgi:ATP-dependent RNA helicase DDX3X